MNDNIREYLNTIVSTLDEVDTHLINNDLQLATADAKTAANRLNLIIHELTEELKKT